MRGLAIAFVVGIESTHECSCDGLLIRAGGRRASPERSCAAGAPNLKAIPGLRAEILQGDDFVQWSIRFGLLLFDDGAVLEAARTIVEERPWPDVERKVEHAGKSLDLARRVVETGDADGALIQVRTALSLAARAYLLSLGVFPLSRAELPKQLLVAGQPESAAALEVCIHEEPSLEALAMTVSQGNALLDRLGTPFSSRQDSRRIS